MPSPQELQAWLEEALSPAQVEVEGDGAHFSAFVVSQAFQGKSRIERHRFVYQALGDKMAMVHALSLRALTPEEAEGKERT